jgi:hypothetical protein
MTASTLQCRLLCACGCAYGIDTKTGAFTPPAPYYDAVGYTATPVPISGGDDKIDAALVGTTGDGVVVAFRGTLPPAFDMPSMLDWLQDLFEEPRTVRGLPGQVHSGFDDSVNAVWAGVSSQVAARLKAGDSQKLYVTGHSKGGAMASIAAMLFHNDIAFPTPIVHTYASARPGDKAFAEAYDRTISQTSYENYLDVVPFVPPSDDIIGLLADIPELGKLFRSAAGWNYQPVGNRLYIEKSADVVEDDSKLDALRIVEIVGKLVELDGEAIGAAHCSGCPGTGCAGGYMRGACPGEVCGAPERLSGTVTPAG